MKQMFFNFGISTFCFPVLLIIMKTSLNKDIMLSIGSIWAGFCLACLINGFICLAKE